MPVMKTAGVREARQHLSQLLDEVRKGREVLLTHRRRPVARLVPVRPTRGFPDLQWVRRAQRGADAGLTTAVLEGREERE